MSEPLDQRLERRSLTTSGGAFVGLTPAAACAAAARAASATALRGSLLAVKELVDVAGFVRAAGSRALADRPPARSDAPVVAALRAGGAVVCGQVGMHELACGVTGVNNYRGTPRNPIDPAWVPGGSSSGSAVAVATGVADLAVGTDTGGSVRIPSALCGVVGFKPAYGSYPLEGVGPLSPSLDHVGLHARRLAPLRLAHQVLTGEDGMTEEVLRFGIARGQLDLCSQVVAAPLRACLEELGRAGLALVEVDLPDLERTFETSTTVMFAEAARTHRDLLEHRRELIGEDVRERLERGSSIGADAYRRALADRDAVAAETARLWERVDIVLGPTVPIPPPRLEEARGRPEVARALVTFTRLANLTGIPALSLPVPGPAGPPAALQVMGASNDLVLEAAARIEGLFGPGEQHSEGE